MADLVTLDVGRAAYEPTLWLQQRLRDEVRAAPDERACLILVEHDPPVITLGRGAKAAHVLASRDRLAREGVELHESQRGGDVTYHGPGQVVGYPILRLDLHGRDVHRYLRDLEEVLLRLLARYGIEGCRAAGMTGVWVGGEKVAAIGVAISRWVTWHGFALNVDPNLGHFGLIVPCGLSGMGVTSMARLLGRTIAVAEVKPPLVECMAEVFGFDGVRPGDVPEGFEPSPGG
ncbi:MAG: lipoyl(octanoyl) transferase LipB [Planctomycetes bacterium]|nr:lipoyl(octanoyl) transferase LipB [Planctomycetota bacterium]